MSVSLKPLQISPDRPLDPITLQTIRTIDGVLREAQVPYMLVGATARDLLLHHVYGHAITRLTYDVDFAILVDSWEQFVSVKQSLLNIHGFRDKREPQRLYYQLEDANLEMIIDIIPFGPVETPEGTIAWPPDASVLMNVSAFGDVYSSSLLLEVAPEVIVNLPSLAGLMLLKLFAWASRHSGKDAQDIRRLLETYADSGNLDRLYDQELAELERVHYDVQLAGTFLLGKDASHLIDRDIHDELSITLSGKPAQDLIDAIAGTMSKTEDRTELAEEFFRGFLRGFNPEDLS